MLWSPREGFVTKMNINPDAFGRLKRLASSALKKKNTPRNSGCDKGAEANKEEGLEKNPEQNKGEEANSDSGSSTGEIWQCDLNNMNKLDKGINMIN